MQENAIRRVVSKLCNTCATKSCVGPYGDLCEDILDMIEKETKKCKGCKYDGQICSGKSCEEGLYGGKD